MLLDVDDDEMWPTYHYFSYANYKVNYYQWHSDDEASFQRYGFGVLDINDIAVVGRQRRSFRLIHWCSPLICDWCFDTCSIIILFYSRLILHTLAKRACTPKESIVYNWWTSPPLHTNGYFWCCFGIWCINGMEVVWTYGAADGLDGDMVKCYSVACTSSIDCVVSNDGRRMKSYGGCVKNPPSWKYRKPGLFCG